MKRFIFGLVAIVMALALNSFTSSKIETASTGKQSFNWYPVDRTTQLTTSTTPVVIAATKAAAIIAQPCKDLATPVCLVGATSAPAVGTAASTFALGQQIRFTN